MDEIGKEEKQKEIGSSTELLESRVHNNQDKSFVKNREILLRSCQHRSVNDGNEALKNSEFIVILQSLSFLFKLLLIS